MMVTYHDKKLYTLTVASRETKIAIPEIIYTCLPIVYITLPVHYCSLT